MRITVIPEDRLIVKDDVPLVFDFPCDAGVHAISWYGDCGDIELSVGGAIPCALSDIQPFIDYYDVEIGRLAQVAADAAAELIA